MVLLVDQHLLQRKKKQKTIRGLEAKLDSRNRTNEIQALLNLLCISPWSLRPAIIFIVFFLVYRDQGFLKPHLDQQKKQKTIKRWCSGVCKLSCDPINQFCKPTKRPTHIDVHRNAKSTWVPDPR